MRFVLIAACLVCACAAKSPPAHVPGDCNPLGGDACLVPYPSSYFQVDDTTSATGVRNAVPAAAMPKNIDGRPINPANLNRLDGFSPATPIILYFPDGGIDISGLATIHDFSPSLAADAPLAIFNMTTGERVDYFAELDATATAATDRQALLIHPQVRLQPATKYAVAIRGIIAIPNAAFVEARDKKLTSDSALWDMQDRYEALFTFLDKQGFTRSSLTMAWDFTTASEDMITGRLVRMRDTALAAATFNYTVTSVTDITDDPHLIREIIGTFDVPSFLASESVAVGFPDGTGANPTVRAPQAFPFVIHIPACARTATAPLPIMIYGHGLLGTGLDEVNTGYQTMAIDRYCMVQVASNWIGLSADDINTIAGTVIEDLGQVNIVTDRLMQAHVNHTVLARLVKTKLKDDASLTLDGGTGPVTDGSQLYYEGISLGAIEGSTFMALTPDIQRAVVNVAGAEWSFLMSRSADFANLLILLQTYMPDRLDEQLALAYVQSLFDETDPVSYAPHLFMNPLPGVTAKSILLQESEGDSQVPNLGTRMLARTAGFTGLSPMVTEVPGVTDGTAPLQSAYVQFDTHDMPLPPDTNVTSPTNNAHEDCRRLEVVLEQIQAFLKPDGTVQQFCTGTCDPN